MKTELIDRIIKAYEAPERGRYRPAERFEIIGTDGKTYVGSLPIGVGVAGRGNSYWVLQSVREGTTHGKRHETRESLVAAFEANLEVRIAEFRSTLDGMSQAEVESQAEYWLRDAA